MASGRRNARNMLFRGREFSRVSARFRGIAGIASNPRFGEFLSAANLEFASLANSPETVVQVAQFADLNVSYGKLARGEVVWPRDMQSLDRAAVVITRRGRVRAAGEGVYLREPGVIFIPPGDTRVSVMFEASENELVYASFPASLVADIPLPTDVEVGGSQLGSYLVDPIYRFMVGLSHAPDQERGLLPVRYATGEMLRAIVQLVSQCGCSEMPLYDRAIQAILQDLGNVDLAAGTLAPRLGVSTRKLQLEFQERGTTVQREVRRRRVAAARQMRREFPEIGVEVLILACGFRSKSAFYRAMSEVPDSQSR